MISSIRVQTVETAESNTTINNRQEKRNLPWRDLLKANANLTAWPMLFNSVSILSVRVDRRIIPCNFHPFLSFPTMGMVLCSYFCDYNVNRHTQTSFNLAGSDTVRKAVVSAWSLAQVWTISKKRGNTQAGNPH